MGKAKKVVGKPKSRSKMSREKKKKGNVSHSSRQEKKFHRKVKSNVPLKKNTTIFQKKKLEENHQREKIDEDEMEEDEEMILPLDMLSDEEMQPGNIQIEEDEEDDDNEVVEEYERQPRVNFNPGAQQRAMLPIKTDRGQLISQSRTIVDAVVMEEEPPAAAAAAAAEVPSKASKPVSVIELIAERQSKLNETKQSLVSLCDLIMKSPYEEISKLKHLRELLNLGDPLISMSIRKLTMLSLVELFRDIVPGYRIRSLKESSKDESDELKKKKQRKRETLSKDVKVIQHFEQTLLKHYQHFLHFLEQCAKKNLPAKSSASIAPSKLHLGRLAVQCLCKLLTHLHHFNFRTNLVQVLVQLLGNR